MSAAEDSAPFDPEEDASPRELARWDTRSPFDFWTTSMELNCLAVVLLFGASWGTSLYSIGLALESGGTAFAWFAIPFFWLTLWTFFFAGQVKGTATAGADGISVSWAGTWRFFAYREIARASVRREHVRVELRNGKEARFRSRHSAAIGEHIEAAIEPEWVDERPREVGEAARGEGTLDEWMQRLDRLVAGTVGYRDAPLDRDAFLRVALDGNTPPSARAGSAFVLSKTQITDDERRAIRSAAEVTAHPKVRVALETVGAGDDEPRARRAVRAAGT
jgi:hypothetical protein